MRIEQIVEAVNGKIIGSTPSVDITGISSLDSSSDTTLSFIVKPAYQKASNSS